MDFSDIPDDKCTINVEFEGRTHTVSWYKGTSPQDVKEAILCACDSIIDSGFTLLDSNGFPCTIEMLSNNEHYSIVPGEEMKGFEKVLGDRMRRVNVCIEPLQHLEAAKAIEIMKQGANLLKHTKSSLPHMRLFQLTADLKHLIWFTASKNQRESSLAISAIGGVQIGQTTSSFLGYPIPSLAHLSFSIMTNTRTLDLTCKDEREFDFWVTGIKTLIFLNKGVPVNKQILLSHSRRFVTYLQKNKILLATESMYEPAETNRLEDYVLRKSLTREEIGEKLIKLDDKLQKIQKRAGETIDENPMIKPQGNDEYVELILDDEGYDEILNTHQDRLKELLINCRAELVALQNEYAGSMGLAQMDNSRFESKLWKIEIDLENAGDILLRWEKSLNPSVADRFVSWFKTKVKF